MGRLAQTVKQLATGWTVRFSNPGSSEILHTCPDRPWVPPSLLSIGSRFFRAGKERPGRDADPSPNCSGAVKKDKSDTFTPPMSRTACTEPQCLYSTAIPLLPLWVVRPVQSLSTCTRAHFILLPLHKFWRTVIINVIWTEKCKIMKLTNLCDKVTGTKRHVVKTQWTSLLPKYCTYKKFTQRHSSAYCRYTVSWLDRGQVFVACGASFNNNNNNNYYYYYYYKARILGAIVVIKRKNQNRKVVLTMAVPTLLWQRPLQQTQYSFLKQAGVSQKRIIQLRQ